MTRAYTIYSMPFPERAVCLCDLCRESYLAFTLRLGRKTLRICEECNALFEQAARGPIEITGTTLSEYDDDQPLLTPVPRAFVFDPPLVLSVSVVASGDAAWLWGTSTEASPGLSLWDGESPGDEYGHVGGGSRAALVEEAGTQWATHYVRAEAQAAGVFDPYAVESGDINPEESIPLEAARFAIICTRVKEVKA